MTTVVILMMGFGAILIISAIETDPTTGADVSVLQTFRDVWDNRLDFSQPSSGPSSPASGGGGGGGGGGSNGGLAQGHLAPLGTAAPSLAFRNDLVRHDVRYRYYGR